jgi:hypothetical protein
LVGRCLSTTHAHTRAYFTSASSGNAIGNSHSPASFFDSTDHPTLEMTNQTDLNTREIPAELWFEIAHPLEPRNVLSLSHVRRF